jgi:MFS transporter, CP family, cyanate transporter
VRSVLAYTVLFLIGIVIVSINLRPAITSVGPLINFIQDDLHLSHGIAGLLTSLPVIAFAIISPIVPRLVKKTSNSKTLIIGLILLFIGLMMRLVAHFIPLIVGTFIIGAGIAILNVVLPGIIKDQFPERFGFMTSVYTTSMSLFAALASGLSVPLAIGMNLGWKITLAIWAIPVFIAILVWGYLLKFDKPIAVTRKDSPLNNKKTNLWTSSLAWQIALFLGLQSFLFYSTITWLPDILHNKGVTRETAGWFLSFCQLIGLPANFFVPIIAARFRSQQMVAIGICACSLIGYVLLSMTTMGWLMVISIILIGVGLGGTFSLALSFLGMRTKDAEKASELSGMAQSLGYVFAAFGPLLIGFLFDLTAAWGVPIFSLMGISVLTAFFGFLAGRDRYI